MTSAYDLSANTCTRPAENWPGRDMGSIDQGAGRRHKAAWFGLVALYSYCLIMARQTKVTMVDDLDGENEAVQTVAFSLESVSYEIDLSDAHASELRTVLQHYAAAGRRVGGRRDARVKGPSEARARVKAPSNSSSASAPPEDVRGWARAQGFEVSGRGRISSAIREAYDAAH